MDITPFHSLFSKTERCEPVSRTRSAGVSELLICSLTIDFSDSFKISPQPSTRTYSALPELLPHPFSCPCPPPTALSPPSSPTASQLTPPQSATRRATLASMLLLKHRPSPQGLCTHCALPRTFSRIPPGQAVLSWKAPGEDPTCVCWGWGLFPLVLATTRGCKSSLQPLFTWPSPRGSKDVELFTHSAHSQGL